ncbi:MAG: hypothetical protein JWM10_3823 [Myxococcaceae bacterium]|nr:hypothetical protein [Myxococcaceae bacterium]
MRNTPLHESHLLEAVRRKILTSDQMEQVIALARSTPAEGQVADVRWATAVQGLIAGAAVMGSAMGIMIDTSDHGVSLGVAAYSALGLAAFAALARYLDRFSWGRVPGSILRAGVAVWSFGVVVGLLSLALPLSRVTLAEGANYYDVYESFRANLSAAYVIAGVASALVAAALWRYARTGPALGLAGAHLIVAATMAATAPWSFGHYSSDAQALVVMAAGGAVFLGALVLDRRPRRAVDGAFWLYPVAMFAMGFAALMRIDRHDGEVFLWLPFALALGGLAAARGRRLPLLFSAAALVIFPAFALDDSHAPAEAVIAILVASATAVALGVQVVRTRDLRAAATAAEPASVWA